MQILERTAHGEDDLHTLLPAERWPLHVPQPILQSGVHAFEHQAVVLAISRVTIELDEVAGGVVLVVVDVVGAGVVEVELVVAAGWGGVELDEVAAGVVLVLALVKMREVRD